MRRIGRYELERPIGAGGMAEVWLARQTGAFAGASKRVAVKVMSEHLAAQPEFQAMFETEVRLSMLLSHSNIVQVFDAGREDGRTFLVMEYVDGMDLAGLARLAWNAGVVFEIGVATHIVAEVLRGLAYAHRVEQEGKPATIVHRDVSPHNVLVSVSGEVKLTDFGVARLAKGRTTKGDIRGKLRYMAPEHARGKSRSPGVDLFGLGAIFHELLAGRRFRDEADPAALRAAVLAGKVPKIKRKLPPEIEAARVLLLHPDSARRYQSADEALAALKAWVGFRQRTEAVAHLCRRFRRPPKVERTSTEEKRWGGIDGTATQAGTDAGGLTGTSTEPGTEHTSPEHEPETVTEQAATEGPAPVLHPLPPMSTPVALSRSRTGIALALGLGTLLLAGAGVYVGLGRVGPPKPPQAEAEARRPASAKVVREDRPLPRGEAPPRIDPWPEPPLSEEPAEDAASVEPASSPEDAAGEGKDMSATEPEDEPADGVLQETPPEPAESAPKDESPPPKKRRVDTGTPSSRTRGSNHPKPASAEPDPAPASASAPTPTPTPTPTQRPSRAPVTPVAPPPDLPAANRTALRRAVEGQDPTSCGDPGVRVVKFTVEFDGDTGRATRVSFTDPPANPAVTACVRRRLLAARVEPFSGGPVWVRAKFSF